MTQAYRYKTKEYSPETGFVFFGARYYNPLIGRFITKDPSGMVDGPNLYVYLNNDPVNKIDPWGLFDLWVSGQDIGPTGEIYGGGGSGDCIGWGDILDTASNILIVGDIINPLAPGLTGEGIIPAAGIQMGKKGAVVIGETMKRVIAKAKELGAGYYKARKTVEQIGFKKALENNLRWLKNQVKQGKKVMDIGIDKTQKGRSPFYEAEKQLLQKLGL